jgi:hypothetical protein
MSGSKDAGLHSNNTRSHRDGFVRLPHRSRRLQGLVIRHNTHSRDYPIAGPTDDVIPGIRVQVIFSRIDLEHGLIATALRAVDLFPDPESFPEAKYLVDLMRPYRGSRFESSSNGCSV